MHPLDYQHLADALLPAVLEAGVIEMRYFAAGVSVERKADCSPVTVADREAEAVLVAGISEAAPGVPIVAEEAVAAGRIPRTGEAFFLVDPLDGTREFVNGCNEFTVNIGLVVDRKPVFGLIYAPAFDALFVTLGRHRAVEAKFTPGERAKPLSECRLTELSARTPDPNALVALESRSHRTAATEEFLRRYKVAESKRAGSSLKFCLIARGEADLYPRIGETSEWDTAAGQVILTAAGGAVVGLDGTSLIYGKAESGYLNPSFVAWARAPVAANS